MGIFSNTWNSVIGKLPQNGAWNKPFYSQWTDKTIDYTKNDYDLYRSLYYGVSISGKAKDMLMGALFAKPIVNTTAGFAMGDLFTIETDNKKVEQSVNDWLDKNASIILNFVIHGIRDGDSYLYVDEYGNLEEIDAKQVTAIIDPQSGLLVGYDVEERYEITDKNNNKTKYVTVKQYRTDSVKYTQYLDSAPERNNGTVIYSRVYTVDGAVEPVENQEFYEGELLPRPLPIIHFANDIEPRSVYGNSELLNCLMGFRNYHAVISNATKGVINSANPIPIIKGVKDASAVARQSNTGETEDTDKLDWSPDTILFMENPEADAKYIQANGFMGDTGQLLEYYFMLIVEASETPEFIFGTAVSSSKASVSEQMPTVIQKATRKRAQLEIVFKKLVDSFIDRRIRMSDVTYLPLKNKEYEIAIVYPDIVSEDKQMTLETVRFLNGEGILSDETTMSLLLSDKIPDVSEELDKARKDNEERMPAIGAVPQETGRLQQELNATEEPNKEPLGNER